MPILFPLIYFCLLVCFGLSHIRDFTQMSGVPIYESSTEKLMGRCVPGRLGSSHPQGSSQTCISVEFFPWVYQFP